MYDLVIKNGKIIDGTGSPSFWADIAIENGKIAKIDKRIEGGKEVIDATGLTVTPGFVDSHGHADNAFLEYPDLIEKIEQGITTTVGGQCGDTKAPIGKDVLKEAPVPVGNFGTNHEVYRTMGTLLDIAKELPQGTNSLTFVGHSGLRSAAMGMEDREPTKEELETMKSLLREAMEHGAIGVSFGLFYAPGCFSKTDEVKELAKVAADCGGMISAHIRDEGYFAYKAVEEMINVAKYSGARCVLSHHKAEYKENWGKVNHTLRMIDEANAEGYDIYCDVYPYNASHTRLSAMVIPGEFRTEGDAGIVRHLHNEDVRQEIKNYLKKKYGEDYSWIQVTICQAYPEYEGKTIPEIAKIHGTDCYDAMFDIIRDSKNICSACYFTMCEEDIETVLAHPRAMVCTDSSVAAANKVYHPRLRATFPRVLGKYVRERKVTTLVEMIRKITAMPAAVYGLKNKGLLREGFDADICIFDENTIIDRASFADCTKRAEGLNYVILGGQVVVENAVYNGKKMGRILLRNE
ncbi:MAG: D-aminoacylase [Clostridia bacterium]|nr:D-aminoacylase [Clostridia bacterium]